MLANVLKLTSVAMVLAFVTYLSAESMEGTVPCEEGCMKTSAESYGGTSSWNCRAWVGGTTCTMDKYDLVSDAYEGYAVTCIDATPADTVIAWNCNCCEKCDGASTGLTREMRPPGTIDMTTCSYIGSITVKECF